MTTIPLKRLAKIGVSNVDKKSVDGELPVRLCNYTDVYYRDEIAPDQDFMPATASPGQVSAFRLRAGDVIITKDSETAEDIGVPTYVRAAAPDLVCGYHLAMLRPDPRQLDGRFLYWFMSSTTAREQLTVAATGVTRFGLRADGTGAVRVPSVPLGRQRAIADYLDSETARIDALTAKKRNLAGLLEERWNASLRWLALESGWPWVPLRRLWTVTDCKHTTPGYVSQGMPVVSPGDVTAGRLDLTRCHRFVDELTFADLTAGGRRPTRGDIVYSRNASIGIASYVDTDEPFTMGQDVCLIRSTSQDQKWLTYMLNSVGVDQLHEMKVGSTFDRVNIRQLLELRIPVPEPSLQRTEAARLDAGRTRVDDLRKKLSKQIVRLQERRKALITAAVTGELEIPGVA